MDHHEQFTVPIEVRDQLWYLCDKDDCPLLKAFIGVLARPAGPVFGPVSSLGPDHPQEMFILAV